MATDQVLTWIQTEVKLSKMVNSFETDFANGYLLGEILCQYGVCDSITKFNKKSNKDAKVQNFYQIEAALRQLKIPFDGKMMNNIMNEERGAALRLLYQLKRAFARTDGEMSGTGLKKSLLGSLRQCREDQKSSLAHTIEYETVGGKDIRSNKLKLQDRHLVGFDIHQKVLFDKAKRDADRDNEIIAKHHQAQRHGMLTSLKENQTFMKQWEQEGRQNWQKNMDARADTMAKVKYFEDREVNLYKAKLEKELNEATFEMANGLSEFEKNLQKLGIEQNVNMDDAIKRMEEKKGIPPGQIQNFSYAATMNKIKETKKASDFAGKERERRRTKLIVDQATTQQQLDNQRQEDLLVQKLLQQQSDEARQAFTDSRNKKCKAMHEQDRLRRAEANAEKTQAQMDKIDQKRREEVRAKEAARQVAIQAQKENNEKAAMKQKLAKRAVNVEIASGLIDLLLDLGNEAFDLMKGKENKKLSKQEWRQFQGLFVDGKKVSLRNVVKRGADTSSAPADQHEIAIPDKLPSYEIMCAYQQEPALPDFYQYLSATGQFDLSTIKPEMWKDQQFSNNLGVSDQAVTVQPNPGLAKLIDDVKAKLCRKYPSVHRQSQSSVLAERDFVLKLCILGRAFAGKKTVAKQIQEAYGGKDNIRIFNMDEVIIEALEYIMPKKVPTQAELQAQAKVPVKKGQKVEEIAPQDIFEGKNTTEYKRLGNALKNNYFPDFEGELPSKIDLTTQVIDDQILIDLFTERLRLEYENKPAKSRDLKAGCARELEILKQLRDIEAAQEQEAAKPVDVKGKKTTAKVVQKGPEESLKEELEAIRKMDVNGWILVGFPKTLTQAKLLEKALSGFQNKYDQPKPHSQKLQDAYSKVAIPSSLLPTEADPEVASSAFDGILFMQVSDEEVHRRARNRKIDPLTNNIYHMEDNPPEETKENLKMIERLQPYENEAGNAERISSVSKRYDISVDLICSFAEQFGLVDPESQTCKVPLNMQIKNQEWSEWRKKDAVKEAVFAQVRQIVDFKQSQQQLERQKIFAQLEEERKNMPTEVSPRNSPKASTQQSPKNSQPNLKTDQSKPEKIVERFDEQKKSVVISISEETLHSKAKGGDNRSTISYNERASMVASSKMLRRVYEINESEKAIRWDAMVSNYYREGIQCFNQIRLLRQRVFQSLNKTQHNFIGFLERPGQLQKKINEFCESYNKFTDEFPQLRDNAKTQEELQSRVNILSLQLWETIQARNQEAVKERAKYMEGGWVFVEMCNLVGFIARMIESEWERFTMTATVVTGFVVNEELDLQTLAKRLAERGTEPFQGATEERRFGFSPILDELVGTLITTLNTLFNEQHFINIEQRQLDIIVKEKDNLFIAINTLLVWGNLALQEIALHSNKVFEVLDDWIVVSVKAENDLCQSAVRDLKQLVKAKEINIDSVLLGRMDLEAQIQTIQFEEGPPLYLQEFNPSFHLRDRRIQVETLKSLFSTLQSNSAGSDLLDYQTFICIMLLSLQSRRLPAQWCSVNFRSVMDWARDHITRPKSDNNDTQILFKSNKLPLEGDNGESTRQFVSWKNLFAAIVLAANRAPTEDEMRQYADRLSQQADPETGLISEDQFIKVPSPFDEVEGTFLEERKITSPMNSEDEEDLDKARIAEVKRLLFKTFKVTNRPGMRVQEFASALESVFAAGGEGDLFEEMFK